MDKSSSHPVLSLDEAKRFEEGLFGGDEAAEWSAMQRAGRAVGRAALEDFGELGAFPAAGRLLVLVGKGHNGGDALVAAKAVLASVRGASADVLLLFGERELRPLAARAYRELFQAEPSRARLVTREDLAGAAYDLWFDGVFGFQFHPPVATGLGDLLAQLNRLPVRFRAAVDLPSGLGDPAVLRADFTYATGSVKTPVVEAANAAAVGRLRYLDLGFFDGAHASVGASGVPVDAIASRVLTPAVLQPLRGLRPPLSDKRTYGHLFVLAGSGQYPGAALMSVLAAVRSGAGLVTAFVPESLVSQFAARVPEAIWVGWPETPAGGLALEGLHLLRERLDRATALLLGPGAGREPETLALLADAAKLSPVPLVIDADGLQPSVVSAGSAARVLTPHAGEFARIAGELALPDFCRTARAVTILKGPLPCISDGTTVFHSCGGGPVLARGGSGDVLAGLAGGLLAQTPQDSLGAACRAVAWQGRAADLLARARGQVAVQTTQILDFLPEVLRSDAC